MPDPRKATPWLRIIAAFAIIGLFVSDYAFDILQKEPPIWAYLVPGLLALGIEANAVGRLLMQIARAIAGVQNDKDN